MATRDSDFPAWLQEDGTLLWVLPLSAQNAQLQYGQFRRLFQSTLRPARDQRDEPLLGFTHDGGIRGQVMMGSGPRHVDIYAKHRKGTTAEVSCWHPTRRDVEDCDELRYGTHKVEVLEVRAQRLADLREAPAWVELAPGTHWQNPEVKRMTGAIAAAVWDKLLEEFRPTPRRFAWRHNPWVWIHRVRQSR